MPNTTAWVQVVTEALKDAPLLPRDEAAKALALEYAAWLDEDPGDLGAVGPKLLAALSALGMTPTSRGVKKKEVSDAAPVVRKLDELQQRRERRTASN